MTPCRLYLTACALSFAFGCMLGLMIANRWLEALQNEQGAPREALGRHKEYEFPQDATLRARSNTQWRGRWRARWVGSRLLMIRTTPTRGRRGTSQFRRTAWPVSTIPWRLSAGTRV